MKEEVERRVEGGGAGRSIRDARDEGRRVGGGSGGGGGDGVGWMSGEMVVGDSSGGRRDWERRARRMNHWDEGILMSGCGRDCSCGSGCGCG